MNAKQLAGFGVICSCCILFDIEVSEMDIFYHMLDLRLPTFVSLKPSNASVFRRGAFSFMPERKLLLLRGANFHVFLPIVQTRAINMINFHIGRTVCEKTMQTNRRLLAALPDSSSRRETVPLFLRMPFEAANLFVIGVIDKRDFSLRERYGFQSPNSRR